MTVPISGQLPGVVSFHASTASAAYRNPRVELLVPTAQDYVRFSAASVLLAQLDADSGSIQDIAMLLAQPPSSVQDDVARLSGLLSRRLGMLLHQEGLTTASPLLLRPGVDGRAMLDPDSHHDAPRVQQVLDSHPDVQALARYLMQGGALQVQTMAQTREPTRLLDLIPPPVDPSRVPWPLPAWMQSRRDTHPAGRLWRPWAIALAVLVAVMLGWLLL